MSESADEFECSACNTVFQEEDDLILHEEVCPERLGITLEEVADMQYARRKLIREIEYEEEDMVHTISEETAELMHKSTKAMRAMEIDHESRKARADARVFRMESQLKEIPRS